MRHALANARIREVGEKKLVVLLSFISKAINFLRPSVIAAVRVNGVQRHANSGGTGQHAHGATLERPDFNDGVPGREFSGAVP